MSNRRIVIEFLGKDKSLGSTTGDVDRKTSRLGDTLKKVGKVAALGLAAGLVVAGKALFDATRGAVADEAAQVKLAQTLRNTAGATDEQIASVEKWITAQGKALGVTDDELRPALQRLTEATGDVGEAQKLASLAMDVSAGTGKSLKTVSEALMKAQNGQISGLSRLGIETKNAAGKTLTFEQATKRMADTFGGQASKKAGTLEGKMARLRLMFDETKETIGAKLIPVATRLSDWFLNKGVPAISKFGTWLDQNVIPVTADLGKVLKDRVLPALGDVAVAVGKVVGFFARHRTATVALTGAVVALVAITKIHAAVLAVQAAGGLAAMIKGLPVVAALTKAWAAAQWVINAALTANPIGIVIAAIALLVGGLVLAYKKSETFRKIVDAAFRGVAEVGRWLWNEVLSPVFRFLVNGFATVMDFYAKMLRGLSKVPGFGWARKAADGMSAAADKARALAGNIKAIPKKKTTRVDYVETHYVSTQYIPAKPGRAGGIAQPRARGGPVWPDGAFLVGEEGPELFMPKQAGVIIPNGGSGRPAGGSGRSAAASSGDGTVARFEIPVVLDGRVIQTALLTLKRRNGGLELGLA